MKTASSNEILTMPNPAKPIIFLAFANNTTNEAHFLRNLDTECQKVQNVLQKIEGRLCRIEILKEATVDKILEVFNKYPRQIAVFHFGGHAGGDHLALETENKERVQLAHADGFADFLGQQSGLELVFLNGCSTQNQVDNLLKANVGAVIATSQAIDDEVATEFAIHFYNSLAAGDGIGQSFREAAASVKIKRGTSMRKLFSNRHQAAVDRFPWDFYVREGAAKVRTWNLPFAAKDPLFSLPPLPPHPLPEKPYRYLEWFREEDAELFFGRDFQIWELYDKVKATAKKETAQTKAAIIHLHGQSGVGKSSLLAGGLTPRLKVQHEVLYIRRNQKWGLLESMKQGLAPKAKALNFPFEAFSNLKTLWLEMEEKLQKPLIVILDQVEEAFTRPFDFGEKALQEGTPQFHPERELQTFIAALQHIFEGTERPKGKVILAYRKEYFAEIKLAFETAKMAYTEVFLERLKRDDIIQAVEGITERPRPKAQYKLSIEVLANEEESLAAQIADDLLKDPESPIAPVLQILLSRLWEMAQAENAEKPVFRWAMYRQLTNEGLWMDSFLRMQLKKIEALKEAAMTEARKSGLILDLLASHVTDLGTATSQQRKELMLLYAHKSHLLPQLLNKLQEFYLLIDPNQNTDKARQKTRLAHDTLAKWVVHTYNSSNTLGQQARRVLRNQLDFNQFSLEMRPLNLQDIQLVEKGRSGMRKWTPDELHLMLCSKALSGMLQDQTVAYRLAEYAHTQLQANALSKRAFFQTFYKAPLYQKLKNVNGAKDLVFSPKEEAVLVMKGHAKAQLYNSEGKVKATLQDSEQMAMACFSSDGKIAALDTSLQLKLWKTNGQQLMKVSIAEANTDSTERRFRSKRFAKVAKGKEEGKCWNQPLLHYLDIQFSADNQQIHLLKRNAIVEVFDLSGTALQTFGEEQESLEVAAFRPHAEGLQVLYVQDKALFLWEINSDKPPLKLSVSFEVEALRFDESDNIVALWGGKTLQLVNLETLEEIGSKVFDEELTTLAVCNKHEKELQIVASFGYANLKWLNEKLEEVVDLSGDMQRINRLMWSRDRRRIWALANGQVYQWRLEVNFWEEMTWEKEVIQDLVIHPKTKTLLMAQPQRLALKDLENNSVQSYSFEETNFRERFAEIVAFSPDGNTFATAGDSTPIRLWNKSLEEITPSAAKNTMRSISLAQLQDEAMQNFFSLTAKEQQDKMKELEEQVLAEVGHKAVVTDLAFSPDGKRLASASEDGSVKVWRVADGQRILNVEGKKIEELVAQLMREFDPKRQDQYIEQSEEAYSNPASPRETPTLPPSTDSTPLGAKGHDKTVWSVAWSADGIHLLTASEDATARVWNVKGQEILRLSSTNGNPILQAAFVGESLQSGFLTADTRGFLTFWDGKGQILWQKEAHRGAINCLRLSPDRTHFLTASDDFGVKIWSLEGELLAELEGHRAAVISADFAAEDGSLVYSASKDGCVRKWLVDMDAIVERAGKLYELGKEERREFGI